MLALRSTGMGILLLGSPRTLSESLFVGLPYLDVILAGVPMDGRGPGVTCVRRKGESGRGSEVLGFLPWGLAALYPGPTEALNLGLLGVGDVKEGPYTPFLRPLGVGVAGIPRRAALTTGTKMPAPGTSVEK